MIGLTDADRDLARRLGAEAPPLSPDQVAAVCGAIASVRDR